MITIILTIALMHRFSSTDMKLSWTGIKSIISTKNSHGNVINKLKDATDNLTTDSASMVNIFIITCLYFIYG